MTVIKELSENLGNFEFISGWKLNVQYGESLLEIELPEVYMIDDMYNLIGFLTDYFGGCWDFSGHVAGRKLIVHLKKK